MAPRKNNNNKKVNKSTELSDFASPGKKSALTKNRRQHHRRGMNMIQAINLEHSSNRGSIQLTPTQQEFIQTTLYTPPPRMFADGLALAHRYALRQAGGPTGLTQEEWESMTTLAMLNSVVFVTPDPSLGPLLNKATPYERAEFYKKVSKRQKELKL